MSPQFPILNGRPIDKWRVTELKEELKRRKIVTRGLKEELVKRLDEAIRQDMENSEEEGEKGIDSDNEPEDKGAEEGAKGIDSDNEPVDKGSVGEEPQLDQIPDDTIQLNENITSHRDEPVDKGAEEGAKGIDCDNEPVDKGAEEGAKGIDCDNEPVDKGAEEGAKGIDSDNEPVDKGSVGEEPQLDQIPDDTIQLNENITSHRDDAAPMSAIGGDGAVNAIGEDGDAKLKDDQIIEDTMPLENTNKVAAAAHIGVSGEDEEAKPKYDEEEESLVSSDTLVLSVEGVNQEVSVETSMIISGNVVAHIPLCEKSLESKTVNKDSKPTEVDAVTRVSQSHNQVYEVSPNLGSEVKSKSFSSDSVSIYEKNELKDNLNANNVDVELDVFKPDIVQSSTCGGPASGGDLPPLVDQKLFDHKDSVDETEDNKSIHEGDDTASGESLEKLKHFKADISVEEDLQDSKKIDFSYSNKVECKSSVIEAPDSKDIIMGPDLSHNMEETNADNKIISSASAEEVPLHDDKELSDVDFSLKSDNIGGTILEKLNLDHYPDDDFMEEDALETKQIDSITKPIEGGNEIGLANLGSFSEKKDNGAALSEKRKFKDESIDEPPKRQRRWNSESLKVPERQSSDIKPCTTPMGSLQATKTESNFSRSDSTVGKDAPKERIVPPSPKPPTTSLRIDHFVRPFTLKAVQELLAKTGKVCSFWMDQIKTHCYVMYSTVEEAAATRNSLYNLQWPPNGGRFLAAEFVDPQDVKMRVEPASATPPVSVVPVQEPPPSSRQQNHNKQQQPPVLPPPPPMTEKLEPPIVTLDDLFKKTIATPRIYYLPLAEEQVAAKLAKGNKNQGGRN